MAGLKSTFCHEITLHIIIKVNYKKRELIRETGKN